MVTVETLDEANLTMTQQNEASFTPKIPMYTVFVIEILFDFFFNSKIFKLWLFLNIYI